MSGQEDPFTLVGDFLHSPYLLFALSLLGVLAATFWLVLAYWTYQDARRRGANRLAWPLAAILFPFVATFVYLLARPPEYTVDRFESRMKLQLLEETLAARQDASCPGCGRPADREFVSCPGCGRRLREPCGGCGRPLNPEWQICPYCPARSGRAGTNGYRSGPGISHGKVR